MAHVDTKAPTTPHAGDSHESKGSAPKKTERYSSSPGIGAILMPIAIVAVLVLVFSRDSCGRKEKTSTDTTSTRPSAPLTTEYERRPVGEPFTIAPGEKSPWYDKPAGATYLQWYLGPQVAERISTDRYNTGSEELLEGGSVLEGNEIYVVEKIRFVNTESVTVRGRVEALFPPGKAPNRSRVTRNKTKPSPPPTPASEDSHEWQGEDQRPQPAVISNN